ncbi:MAG: methyltransferase family protein [Syntrophomonadaceae bacterium]
MNTRQRNVFIRMIIAVAIFIYIGYMARSYLPKFDFITIMSFIALYLTWSIIETLIYRQPQTYAVEDDDRRSFAYMQFSSVAVLLYAMLDFTGLHISRINSAEPIIIYTGFLVFILSSLIRYQSIRQLGHYYNPRVAVYQKHELIAEGIYKHLRHPFYLSAVLNTVAIALIFSSFGAVLLVLIAVIPAILYRITIEEEFMSRHFPDKYPAYMQTSKRLIPGIW